MRNGRTIEMMASDTRGMARKMRSGLKSRRRTSPMIERNKFTSAFFNSNELKNEVIRYSFPQIQLPPKPIEATKSVGKVADVFDLGTHIEGIKVTSPKTFTASSRMQTSAFGRSKWLRAMLTEGSWSEAFDGLGISYF
ncbi:hypothetical protein L1987_75898 [Smallanthus sonchifolius]|uniref:Uncharacterized protein n=1 Tax=Smallanthus sonchifolius TaxID=185202 RepID=A0ACB9A608_9ASTR|nr:hypothetical protein L1987_75898 [Smallanthus sonchifolius]